MTITRQEVLMGRDKEFPLSEEQEANLTELLTALNKFRAIYGKPMKVSSGYRPESINSTVKGAAKKSNHIMCLACDFVDTSGELDKFCLNNLEVLEKCGLWLESPAHTPNWCHLQCRPPKSGRRIFLP